MAEADFRSEVSQWGPCLHPNRYPGPARGGGTLPISIPSEWYTTHSVRGGVVLRGRGWGHGVGMVQWGAYGKARRGRSAAQILAYYYGGLRPSRYPEPGLIHVQVATGLTSLSITPSGSGARLDGRAIGGRGLRITGGHRIQVTSG